MFAILRNWKGALSVGDLAKVLKVSPVTIYRLAADGTIPSAPVGRSLRFDGVAVAKALEGR